MKFYVYIDDERNYTGVLNDDCVLITCRSYSTAIEVLGWIQDNKWKAYVDLDHDLGEEKTGYDICKFIVENQISILGYALHTMNPVGRQNMYQLLSHYGYALIK